MWGGATGDETKNNTVLDVSIHAPHAGGQPDGVAVARRCHVSIHAPHAGGQLGESITGEYLIAVSIHAPAGGQLKQDQV